jgi:two-component system, OmpR family, phosphate regulon sensor histidine kinase PhoR
MLAVLMPTVLTIFIAIVLLATGGSYGVVAGILVLALCATGITGYILGTIFVGKGASLVRIQNDFMSSVSHELRTPLTSIRLFMESLRDGRLPSDERDKVIALLGGEVDRLDLLINRVLELSRMETGRHSFHRTAIDIESLVREAISAFDAATLSKPTHVEVHVESGLAMIGDRTTLVRALMNLLVNAWKYTDAEKRIVVTARGAGRYVDISVKDNGIGIDAGEQRNVFEEFHRAPAALDLGIPGVGLGLAFVRAIARAHKGRVLLASKRGIGSQFTLHLRRGHVLGMPGNAKRQATAPEPARDHGHATVTRGELSR